MKQDSAGWLEPCMTTLLMEGSQIDNQMTDQSVEKGQDELVGSQSNL